MIPSLCIRVLASANSAAHFQRHTSSVWKKSLTTNHRHHREEIIPDAQPINPAHFEQLLHQLQKKKRIVLITGAGCSTESGIPDYRSPNGSYSKGHTPMKYQEFVNSELNRKRYWARSVVGFKQFVSVLPNAGHKAIAELERLGYISHIITQNVDRLHQMAGSQKVLELHGHIDQIQCLKCNRSEARWAFQELLQHQNSTWLQQLKPFNRNERRADADAELGISNDIYSQFHSILKPSVVFFGESIPKVVTTESIRLVEEEADAIICAGTSMQVYSVYRLILAALGKLNNTSENDNQNNLLKRQKDVPVYIINIGPTRADEFATLKIASRVGDVFSALHSHLK